MRLRYTFLVLGILFISAFSACTGKSKSEDRPAPKRAPVKLTEIVVAVDNVDTIAFPQVIHPNKSVQEKINLYLQWTFLHSIASPGYLPTLVKQNAYADDAGGSILNMDATIIRNDGKLLSMLVFIEGMGAYPSSWNYYLTFDLTDGSPVNGTDLFTEAGLEEIKRRIVQQRKALVREGVKHLYADTSGYAEDGIDSAQLRDIEEELMQCAAEPDLDYVLLSDTSFNPAYMRCLPHVIEAFDIDWDTPLPITSITNNLSEYGKSLLGLGAEKPNPNNEYFTVLKGTVGKFPVTMILPTERSNDEDMRLEAHYFYDTKGKAIPLEAKRNGDTLELREETEEGKRGEHFKGTMKDHTFTGTWYDASGKKSLPFVLAY